MIEFGAVEVLDAEEEFREHGKTITLIVVQPDVFGQICRADLLEYSSNPNTDKNYYFFAGRRLTSFAVAPYPECDAFFFGEPIERHETGCSIFATQPDPLEKMASGDWSDIEKNDDVQIVRLAYGKKPRLK